MAEYTSTEQKNIALTRRAFSYWDQKAETHERDENSHEALFEILADDVVFEVTCPTDTYLWGEPIRGKQAVIKHYTEEAPVELEGGGSDLASPARYYAEGDTVVIVAEHDYTIKKSQLTNRKKPFVHLCEFENGLMKRLLVIEDLAEWRDAHRDKKSVRPQLD